MPATPTIIIDTREQAPLHFKAYPTERDTLDVGDYGIRGFSDWDKPDFVVERKSVPDLCGSLGAGRETFMREIEKMRKFQFAALVIEGTFAEIKAGRYRSMILAKSMLASLDMLAVRYGVHVYFCGDAAGAARQVEGLVRQFVKGIEKSAKLLETSAPKGT